uniref:Mce/MlaD domain-containing protein n=1 Tax=Polysiphonia elongata TaxID=159753 RepID=A0A1Z1MBU1_9FLOR|nr:hypothetical protein [Polysiphonia elongata]ARW63275.1 hypothetical protein [Polysiphonia elongata]
MNNRHYKPLKTAFSILVFIFFAILCIFSLFSPNQKSYSLFIEFDDAHGLKEGTPVMYKGVNIGSVSRISLSVNKVVALLNIKSSNILLPCNTIFEANQIGLFNDIIISITPYYDCHSKIIQSSGVYGIYYNFSKFIPHNSYIQGYKGVSYDDLIRSTTRISQRFDDPRFFSLFYLLLKNSFYISDEILMLMYNSSIFLQVFMHFIFLTLSQYLL